MTTLTGEHALLFKPVHDQPGDLIQQEEEQDQAEAASSALPAGAKASGKAGQGKLQEWKHN